MGTTLYNYNSVKLQKMWQ